MGSKGEEGLDDNKGKAAAGSMACLIAHFPFAVNFLHFLSHQSLSTQLQNE